MKVLYRVDLAGIKDFAIDKVEFNYSAKLMPFNYKGERKRVENYSQYHCQRGDLTFFKPRNKGAEEYVFGKTIELVKPQRRWLINIVDENAAEAWFDNQQMAEFTASVAKTSFRHGRISMKRQMGMDVIRAINAGSV